MAGRSNLKREIATSSPVRGTPRNDGITTVGRASSPAQFLKDPFKEDMK